MFCRVTELWFDFITAERVTGTVMYFLSSCAKKRGVNEISIVFCARQEARAVQPAREVYKER
jgi:hypothetical protein